jgi:hypothetical protein
VTDFNTVEEAYRTAFSRKAWLRRKRKRSDAAVRSSLPPEHDRVPAQVLDVPAGDVMETSNGTRDVELESVAGPQPEYEAPEDTTASEQQTPTLHYYLSKPNTTSKVKCLIPLAADSKLIDVLRGRPILEFPTFYARQEPPEALPLPFMTEAKYDEEYGTDIQMNLPTYAPNQDVEEGEIVDMESINEAKVLEVLQKDLNS